MIGIVGLEERCVYVELFGVDVCFDYIKVDWYKRVFDIIDGKGVDVIFDFVGLVDFSLKCIVYRG